MKVLVFEGIATSGKTVIIEQLVKTLPSLSIKVVDEAKSHMPINKQQDDLHVDFFKKLVKDAVDEAIKNDTDLLVFDRLYLTQAFRAKARISDYAEIEEMLLAYSPTMIFLKVNKDIVAQRVTKAIEHRDPKWGEYVKTKGKTTDEIAGYYINQQRELERLIKGSMIPCKVFDTTHHNYQEIIEKLAEIINA